MIFSLAYFKLARKTIVIGRHIVTAPDRVIPGNEGERVKRSDDRNS